MDPELSSAEEGGVEHVRPAVTSQRAHSLTVRSVVTRRWRMLAAGVILGAAFGVFFANQPPMYEASTTVYLTPVFEPSGLSTAAGLHAVLNNQTNASAVLQQLGLEAPQTADARAFLRESLTIEQIPNGYFFRIKVRLRDPQLAARAADAVSERGIELISRLWRDVLAARPAAIEKQFEVARQGLAAAEQRLVEHEQSIATPASKQSVASDDALSRLRAEVEIKRAAYIDAGARYERARAELGAMTPPLRLVDRAVAPGQRVSLSARQRVAFAVLAGLVAAACLAVALESRQFLRGSTSHGTPR